MRTRTITRRGSMTTSSHSKRSWKKPSKANGGNNFKLPHLGKEKLRSAGTPLDYVSCDPEIYNLGMYLVNEL